MEFFYVTNDFSFTFPFDDGNRVTINLKAPKNGQPDFSTIYAATGACTSVLNSQLSNNKGKLPPNFKIKILDPKNKKQIYELDEFPIVLSNFDGTQSESDYSFDDVTKPKWIPNTKFIELEKRIKPILDYDSVKVFIVNGMGTGLGDGIMGLSAVKILYNRLKKYFKDVTIDLSHTAVIGDKAHQSLYSQESIVNEICYLPVSVEKLLDYDLIIDNSAMIIRENFNELPMVDFYLRNMSIDHTSVPDSEKRIFIRKSDYAEEFSGLALKNLRKDPNKKLILLHTSSSTALRSIPRNLIKKAIKSILDIDPNFIVVTWDKLEDVKQEINDYLGPRRSRHVNLNFKNQGFDHYVHIISQMDGIVTVDTSSYHISDAFDIPTLVIFQTIDPELRLKYYPFCEGVELTKNNKLNGVHLTFDKEHVEYINGLWNKFDFKKNMMPLKKAMIKKATHLKDPNNYIECPTCHSTNYKKPSDMLGEYKIYHCHNCKSEFTDIKGNDNFIRYNPEYYFLNDKTSDEVLKHYLFVPKFEVLADFFQTNTEKGTHLHFGCTNGFLVHYTAQLGYDSYGLEPEKNLIDYANRTFGFEKNRIQQGSNLKSTPKNMPESFDIITSDGILESVQNPKDFIKDVYDRLNPGGFGIFITLNRSRLQYVSGSKNAKKHNIQIDDYPPAHIRRFSIESLKLLFQDTNFDIFSQNTSRIFNNAISALSGSIPEITVNVNNTPYHVPKKDLDVYLTDYFRHSSQGVTGLGDFIITIVRKPK